MDWSERGIKVRLEQMPVIYRKNYRDAVQGKCSPRQAIKAHCLECVGWDRKEVTLCTAPACPLYRFRPFQGSSQ